MKAARQSSPQARGCLGCPCRAPSGRCLDTRIKSGRCGDWVWYLRRNQQLRRLYVKPQDPRTPRQLCWRARFGAASTTYSRSLTQDQREACIAAGAKLRSRPRLAQSGPMTGQHYSIRMQYAADAAERTHRAEQLSKGLQKQGLSLSTPETHRSMSGHPPELHRRYTGQMTSQPGRGRTGAWRRHALQACSGQQPAPRFRRSRWRHCRDPDKVAR